MSLPYKKTQLLLKVYRTVLIINKLTIMNLKNVFKFKLHYIIALAIIGLFLVTQLSIGYTEESLPIRLRRM